MHMNAQIGYQMPPFGHRDTGPAQRKAVASFVAAVRAAVADYGTPRFKGMQQAGLSMDLSWSKPAEEWERALLQLASQRSVMASG